MKQLHHRVDGEKVTINVVERPEDLAGFSDFINDNVWLGVDTETTGLDIYSDTFRLRVVQFGNMTEAWVIPVERFGWQAVTEAVLSVGRLVFQNASFDLQVLDKCLNIDMERLWPKVIDTKILAHLIDPRGRSEGGVGHSLEDLTRHYIDSEVADQVKCLMKELASEQKTTVGKIWSEVEFDNPLYQLYAGMDPILAARLAQKLKPLVPQESVKLIRYEHRLAEICSYMERRGFQLDVEYAEKLSARLKEQELDCVALARFYGCESVFAPLQVAAVLESRGVQINDFTPTGRPRVDKKLLDSLAEQDDPFAIAVVEAKKSRKWRTTWVDSFLSQMDSNGRCHPQINPLRARTARMSITGIPAQTLPAGDWLIRRCFVAEEGHRIASVDYQAQELRVLAGMSGDPTMIRAFKTGADLHQITADASGVDRKIGKLVNFAYVYGSGPTNIAEQSGISVDTAREVIRGFERSYPMVKKLSQDLQRTARRQGFVVTQFGRRLPVDEDRAYSALNYMVQSTSRDVTASGLLRLHKAGFTSYLRLPIHDEILASLPAEKAVQGAKRIGELMATRFEGVFIGTDSEVGGRSWGSLYGSDY